MSGEHSAARWIEGDLTITSEVLTQIQQHAREAYPSECCGFLSGPADEPSLLDAFQREDNEADKYHKLDPETFPRTSRDYFKINELRAAKAFAAGEKSGRPIKVIYHSHPDVGAYFSAEDAGTFASNNTLMWPCAFIVMASRADHVADTKLWVHVPGTNDFRESPLKVRASR
ncbi:MAG: Sulfur carrier protein adenylyltransferase ThiF [Myxococcaceae bacterium]|nr:Sulfur carrier protein adenylyltransferase ThiF [Myxococcaceae bacterium]